MIKTTYEELLGKGSSTDEVCVFEDNFKPNEKPKLLISLAKDVLCINFLRKSKNLVLNKFFVMNLDDIRQLKEILKGYW